MSSSPETVPAWALVLSLSGLLAMVIALRLTRSELSVVPAEAAEPWMLQALPGVGPQTAQAMTAAVRKGDFDALPTTAQSMARTVFAAPKLDVK